MKAKKEVKVEIFQDVYCSSTAHHFIAISVNGEYGQISQGDADIYIKSRDKRVKREKRYRDRRAKYPKYIWQAIADELLKAIKADDWVFYEMDIDGKERYSNLRYHEKGSFDHFVKWLHGYLCEQHGLVPLLPSE